MTKFYAFAASALFAATSFSAFALEEGVTCTFDPALEGVYEEFPETFSITFAGEINGEEITAVSSKIGSNPVKVITPDGSTFACTGTFNGNTVTVTPNKNMDRTVEGTYQLQLPNGGFYYVTAAGKTAAAADPELGAYTVATEGIKTVISPAPGTYEELPESFTFTFSGTQDGKVLTAVSKNTLTANPVFIYLPDGTTKFQCSGTFDGNKLVVPAHASIDRNVAGEYVVELRKDGVYYNFNDGSKAKSGNAISYTFSVTGNGTQDPGDENVKYDVELSGTVPNFAKGVDISNKTFETVQFIFNMGKLKVAEGATATITGPDYNYTAPLSFIMGNDNFTYFKGMFPKDPQYNGTYTLTIAQGSVGNEAWIADPEKGHANAAVNMQFEIYGGKEAPGQIVETTFNPVKVTPTPGSKPAELTTVTMTFPEYVYFKEGSKANVGIKTDQLASGFSDFGTASVARVSDTEVSFTFDPIPTQKAEYQLTVPQGFFWNAAHEADANAGAVCSQLPYSWMMVPVAPEANVINTVPNADERVGVFPTGYQIVVNTDNNAVVGSMTLTIEGYELDNDSAMPHYVLSDEVTTDKNAEGAICWTNDGAAINLKDNYYYVMMYTLKTAAGVTLTEGEVEFYGDSSVTGVDMVTADGQNVIYNLQGLRVNRTVDALPAGLYIINGKKVVKK